MRLRSVVLHGFKSFGERAELRILPGVTAVVGPNGCGKSNISEAIRWALGEQSARELRGERMEDLIFHGSASRRPVGLADVELIFTNDGRLPVAWSEVSVGRRLYRTGESEYRLNGEATRLRDILDLFAGTGANPRAYSVMSQERLAQVLTARPHDRRLFIEEAAGIARYKQQRGQTQAKLDAARQNLARVRDVTEEVRRQAGSLERQARRAQAFRALEAEARTTALAVLATERAAVAASVEALGTDLDGLRRADAVLLARSTALDARHAAQGIRTQDAEYRAGDLRQALQKSQSELERMLERRDQLALQGRDAVDEQGRIAEDLRAAGERLGAVADDRARSAEELVGARAIAAESEAGAARIEAALAECQTAVTAGREAVEAARAERFQLAESRAELERGRSEIGERVLQLERRNERLAADLGLARAEGREAAESAARALALRGSASEHLAAALDRRERAQADRVEADAALARAETVLAAARVELAGQGSAFTALEELERAREGYGAGVRRVLGAGDLPRARGVLGTVAELLDVTPELERAVEAVLGERLGWVVVGSFGEARAAAEELRASAGGTACFLVAERLARSTVLPIEPGSIAARVGSPVPGLVERLFGGATLVPDLEEAAARLGADGRRLGDPAGRERAFVTPAGEVASWDRLAGGTMSADAPGSLLARRRRVRELGALVRDAQASVQASERAVAERAGAVERFRSEVEELAGAVEVLEREHAAYDKAQALAAQDVGRGARWIETLELEVSQVAAELGQARARLVEYDTASSLRVDTEAASESSLVTARATLESAQGAETVLHADASAARVTAARERERSEALERELVRLGDAERELRERVGQLQERQAQAAGRVEWLATEEARVDGTARAAAVERDRLDLEARRVGEACQAEVAALGALEAERRSVVGELAGLRERSHAVELSLAGLRVRLEESAAEAGRRWSVAAEELDSLVRPGGELDVFRERQARLGERLAAFGAVNLVADEEHRELAERLAFLTSEHDDLVASIRDLEGAIRGMTRSAQQRFNEAFTAINARFGELFGRLFEGGHAELRLVDPEEGDDPLDTGIELLAQPRGKRLLSCRELSGGESALTGLALLFAIFYFRPSPFCVLDEVDAPLDDANNQRFLRLLRELTAQTQFLVISHNRQTMEAADVLYGVTMEEAGLSTLVSVDLDGRHEAVSSATSRAGRGLKSVEAVALR